MGDLFLVWSPSEQAFTRTGIVECVAGTGSFDGGVGYFRCRTIEAFTPDHAVLDGVKRRTRKLSPECGDRFVRWVDLDARAAVSDALSVDMAAMRLAKAA